jgi:hypothetical protein
MEGDVEGSDSELSEYAAVVGTYQAEARTFQNGCTQASDKSGFTGTGFMDFGGNGSLIEWNNVHAPTAGQYNLVFRYSNGSTGNRQCAITVNDSTNAGNVSFGATGSWKTWKTTSIKVTLKQGNNKIRVTANTGSGGPNLDKMDLTSEEVSNPQDPVAKSGPLDKAGNTKLRIASWNNHRGSIFPKTTSLWKAINTSGKYHVTRTEGAARILDAVEADIWLMQETAYSESGLPSGVTEDAVNKQIASYMNSVTGDSWKVKCNGRGLCTMVRGSIKFDGHWRKGTRVTGDRVILPNGTKVLLVNVHYMNTGHAEDTKKLIQEVGSSVSTVFVAGDFNDAPGGSRYNIIHGISGMNNLSMVHWKDPNAKHVKSSVQTASQKNTKGYMKFGEGPSGQDLVISSGGGQIDHFFLKSNTWKAGNRFILNTLLFARSTLNLYGIKPLDIALRPDIYSNYFRDFLTKGIIYDVPSSAYDSGNGLDHDHLPMIADFAW